MEAVMDFKDIEHHFDREFYYGWMKETTHSFLASMFDETEVTGLEKIASIPKDKTIIWILMHKSHIDYLIFPFINVQQIKREAPAIAAGDNLIDLPVLGEVFRKCKAFKIYRFPDQVPGRGAKDVLRQEKEYISQELLAKHEDAMFFAETKRSYTGELLHFNEAVINIILSAQIDAGTDIYFVPVTINYERVSEDRHFRTFEKYKKLASAGKPPIWDPRILQYAVEWMKYYAFDVPMIYAQRYVRGMERFASVMMMNGEVMHDPRKTTLGNVYVNIGEPHLITAEEAKSNRRKLKTELSTELRRDVGRLAEVLPSDLVARAVQTTMHSRDINEAKKKLVFAEMERLRDSYTEKGFRTGYIQGDITDVFQRGMLIFVTPFRGALYSYNGTVMRNPRRKHIIAYYSSRLNHFEEEGMSLNERRTSSN